MKSCFFPGNFNWGTTIITVQYCIIVMLRYTSHKLGACCARCCISKGQKHDIFGLITISGEISSLHSFVPSTCFSRVLYSREHSVNYSTSTASFKYSSDTKPTALSFSCFQQGVNSCWLLDQAFYLKVKANTSLLPLNSSTDPSSLRRAERLWKERQVFVPFNTQTSQQVTFVFIPL